VIACIAVLILVGLGFFFLTQIIGGGRELQHAVDSGALSIAKAYLRNPALTLADMDRVQQENFSLLLDDTRKGGPAMDLLTYNRAVGQAVLVAANAEFDGGGAGGRAAANARTLLNEVQGSSSSSLANKLHSKLSDPANMAAPFEEVTSDTALRMFGGGHAAAFKPASPATAFMARGKASNVFIQDNSILGSSLPRTSLVSAVPPPGVTVPSTQQGRFLPGYLPLSLGRGISPVAVPLRPFEAPHLVSFKDAFSTAPSIPGFVPNAFQAAGTSLEIKSGKNVDTFASAVVGSLDQSFPAAIPCGYIKFTNLPGAGATVTVPNGLDVFAGIIMSGAVLADASGTVFTTDPFCIQSIEQFKLARFLGPGHILPGVPVPPAVLSCLQGGPGLVSGGTAIPMSSVGFIPIPIRCQSPPQLAPQCIDQISDIAAFFGAGLPGPGPTQTFGGLMAVEKLKIDVIDLRSALLPSQFAGVSRAFNEPRTGLKDWDPKLVSPLVLGGPPNRDIIGTSPVNILRLLAIADSSGQVLNELRIRVRQMNPNPSQSLDRVLQTKTLALGETTFLSVDKNGNFQFTASVPFGLPAIPADGNVAPSTNRQTILDRHIGGLAFDVINQLTDGGFPSPWDCPGSESATSSDGLIFRRSSGFGGNLGEIQFFNDASASAIWSCPC
jgi:hypothetical protein